MASGKVHIQLPHSELSAYTSPLVGIQISQPSFITNTTPYLSCSHKILCILSPFSFSCSLLQIHKFTHPSNLSLFPFLYPPSLTFTFSPLVPSFCSLFFTNFNNTHLFLTFNIFTQLYCFISHFKLSFVHWLLTIQLLYITSFTSTQPFCFLPYSYF